MSQNKIIVINCKTKKDFISLLEIFVSKEWNWGSGAYPLARKYFWMEYKDETCITYENHFSISHKKYFKTLKNEYKIITFTEFLKTQQDENIIH